MGFKSNLTISREQQQLLSRAFISSFFILISPQTTKAEETTRALHAGLQQPCSIGGTSSISLVGPSTEQALDWRLLWFYLYTLQHFTETKQLREATPGCSLSVDAEISGERTWTHLLSTTWAKVSMRSTHILMLGLPGDFSSLKDHCNN